MLRESLISMGAFAATVALASASPLEFIRVGDKGKHFVAGDSGRQLRLWGVNYDHDRDGKLLEDYWHDQWSTVVEDFREIKALNANCVRIHLQFGRFMNSPREPNAANLAQLARLIALAEENELYLILTGLGCYHKQDVPAWYDELAERERWQAQAAFWRAIAGVAKDSPAVFAYDLMNEPILPGDSPEADWLAKPLGDKYFVQRISRDLAGRSRQQVAQQWVAELAASVRAVDARHMITLGVIPWAQHFPGAKPLFYSAEVGGPLDFVSVHFYPKKGEVQKALDALQVYDVGKPIVVEEIFPLHAGSEEVVEFIHRSKPYADGWISFYWGETLEECRARRDLPGALTADWLERFSGFQP
jgi:hypothetical protein